MSYFVKITVNKKGKYLQIYDSGYVKGEKNNKSVCVQTLGYENDLRTDEIPDPISYYREYAKSLNAKRKSEKQDLKNKKVGNSEVVQNLGVCLPDAIVNTLNYKAYVSGAMVKKNRRFNHGELLLDMINARIIDPQSKSRTYYDVLPKLKGNVDYSLDDIYACLEDVGEVYDNMIAYFNHCLSSEYKFNLSHSYFDCTNFYFEIDKEDDLRKKGPSKENRKSPILGMGLLLDANSIPITMELYPGNQSEQTMLGKCIAKAKKGGFDIKRTIRIADKGLNSGQNIHEAMTQNDGYIFSKSVLKLAEKERNRIDDESGYTCFYNNNGEVIFKHKSWTDNFTYTYSDEKGNKRSFEVREKRVVIWNKSLHEKKEYEYNKIRSKLSDLILSKAKREEFKNYASYVKIYGVDKNNEICEKTKVEINEEKLANDIKYGGYVMLVTSEINNSDIEIYDAYHNLWRIEESFRILKTNLNARPVFVYKEERIYGHFLICYLAFALIRILQHLVLKDEVKYTEIFNFIKEFAVTKVSENNNINLIKQQDIPNKIRAVLPSFIDNVLLNEKHLATLKNYKISLK